MAAAEGRREGIKEGLKEGLKEGKREGLKEGIKKEHANSEKKMNIFVKRIAQKMHISEKEILALKP